MATNMMTEQVADPIQAFTRTPNPISLTVTQPDPADREPSYALSR
jgi:hypothetical protein